MKFLIPLALLLFAGCGADEARVENLVTGRPTTFELHSVQGDRDGARTTARVVFQGAAEQLEVNRTRGYDPQPELVEGTWRLGDESGTVYGESVRFVGGQGQGPSVGGSYVLNDESGSRFRVHLPLTRIESGWSVDG